MKTDMCHFFCAFQNCRTICLQFAFKRSFFLLPSLTVDLQIYRNPSKVAAFYFVIHGNASCPSPRVLSYTCPFYWNKYYHCPIKLGNSRQLLLFQTLVFVFSDISIIFQPEIQQQKLDSDSFLLPFQTLMFCFIQSPPLEVSS